MKTYFTILDVAIEDLVKRIKCKSDIVVITISKVFKNCFNEVLGYLEKNDIKVEGKIEHDIIHIKVLMENEVFSRKIGKYVKDQQKKIINNISALIKFKLEKIDWEEVLK